MHASIRRLPLLLAVCVGSFAQQNESLSKIDPELRALTDTGQRVAVLIRLAEQPQEEILGRHRTAARLQSELFTARLAKLNERQAPEDERMAAIREEEALEMDIRRLAGREIADRLKPDEDHIDTLLTGLGARKIRRFSTLGRMAAEIPVSALGALETDPVIDSVYPDTAGRASLERSVIVLGASTWWTAIQNSGAGRSVAVLDTGIAKDHPGFAGLNIVDKVYSAGSKDNVCFDDDSTAADRQGHGTHVSGIVASRGSSAWTEYRGVAPGLNTLYSYKVGFKMKTDKTDARDCTKARGFAASDIVAALDDAFTNTPVRIFNMSFGAPTTVDYDSGGREFDEYMERYGAIFAIAAGNTDDPDANGNITPCGIDGRGTAYNGITVGNWGDLSRIDPKISNRSCTGPTVGGRVKPDLAAPGKDIVSANYLWNTGPIGGADIFSITPDYVPDSGTSMAAPHIAGALALLAGAGITNPMAAKAILINSTTRNYSGSSNDAGWGYADLSIAAGRRNYVTGTVYPGQSDWWLGTPDGLVRASLVWRKSKNFALSNLDLFAYSTTGGDLIRSSESKVDNVEAIQAARSGQILIEVRSAASSAKVEEYALALDRAGFQQRVPAIRTGCSEPLDRVPPGAGFQVTCTVVNDSGSPDMPRVTVEINLPQFGHHARFLDMIPSGQSKTVTFDLVAPSGVAGWVDLPFTTTTAAFGGLRGPVITSQVFVTGRTVTIQSIPTGRTVVVDQKEYRTPARFEWVEFSEHSIEAKEQTEGGGKYTFRSWSDGGTASHTIPAAAGTVTVTFGVQYRLQTNVNPSTAQVIVVPQSSDGYYDSGTEVLLTAVTSGSTKIVWEQPFPTAPVFLPQLSVRMDGPRTVTANFGPLVIIRSNPPGAEVVIDGYTTVRLTEPIYRVWVPGTDHTVSPGRNNFGDAIYRLRGWNNGVSDFDGRIVMGNEPLAITGNFNARYRLSVEKTDSRLSGVIETIPYSGDMFFDAGQEVQIKPVFLDPGTRMLWGGDATGADNPLMMVMDRPKTLLITVARIGATVIQTNPPGRSVTVDGRTYATPASFNWQAGEEHSLSAPVDQIGPGERMAVTGWSNGGGALQTIRVPEGGGVYTANFVRQFQLTFSASPDRDTFVLATPSRVNGGWYDAGTTVGLQANAAMPMRFKSWSGDLSGELNPQTLLMDRPKSARANFVMPVAILSNPAGRRILVDDKEVTTPATMEWLPDESHTLKVASPQQHDGRAGQDARYVFSGWNGGVGGGGSVFVQTGQTAYTANFTSQYKLNIATPTGGSVSKSPDSADGYYDAGTTVRLEPFAPPPLQFVRFEGEPTAPAVAMTQPRFVTAIFGRSVTFASNPPGLEAIVDGRTMTTPATVLLALDRPHTFGVNASQASATPGTRYSFTGWTDSGPRVREIPVGAGFSDLYTANYRTEHRLMAAAAPVGFGEIESKPASPDGYYPSGTTVELFALAANRRILAGWTGGVPSPANPVQVVMDGPKSVTANFNLSVIVDTQPTGRQFIVDGQRYGSRQTFSWPVGGQHRLSLPTFGFFSTTQPVGQGTRHVFQGWSDAGAVDHEVTANATTIDYTAVFRTQHLLTLEAAPAGSGTVTAEPSSVDGFYPAGTDVRVTAAPVAPNPFRGWGGDISGTSLSQVVKMVSPVRVIAGFGAAPPPVSGIQSPAPNSQLPGPNVVFQWLPVPDADNYLLTVGASRGGPDYFNGLTASTSQGVNSLPCDGRMLWVRLQTRVNGQWQEPRDYTYTAAASCGPQ